MSLYHPYCAIYYTQAIRVYLHIRKLLQNLNGDIETQLPLSKSSDCVKVGDVLDLSKWITFHSTKRAAQAEERKTCTIKTSFWGTQL